MKTITIKALLEKDNPIIIDVREPDEYRDGHIPTAINIPLTGVLFNAEHLFDKNEVYYLACQTGKRGQEATQKLTSLGFDATNIIGGTEAYFDYIEKEKLV